MIVIIQHYYYYCTIKKINNNNNKGMYYKLQYTHSKVNNIKLLNHSVTFSL